MLTWGPSYVQAEPWHVSEVAVRDPDGVYRQRDVWDDRPGVRVYTREQREKKRIRASQDELARRMATQQGRWAIQHERSRADWEHMQRALTRPQAQARQDRAAAKTSAADMRLFRTMFDQLADAGRAAICDAVSRGTLGA